MSEERDLDYDGLLACYQVGEMQNAALKADNERLRKGLNEVRAFLENPAWGTWPYMEGDGVYNDKDMALFNIRYALGEIT